MRLHLLLILCVTGCAAKRSISTDSPLPPTNAPDRQATRIEAAPTAGTDSTAAPLPELAAATLYFEFDQSVLEPQSAAVLQGVADAMRANKTTRISIAGHSDDRGTTEYNLALGQQRAQAAKRYLVALGVEAERISTTSYGEETPAVPGQSEEAYAANRRDVIQPL